MTLPQFRDKYIGKQVEYHSYSQNAYYQCTDLVNQYIVEVLNLTPVIGTDAKDFPSRVKPEEFEVIKNTPDFIPSEGMICVWNGRVGGGAGHIAIVKKGATINQFPSLDQNWSKPLYVTEEVHNYTNVSYFLRGKVEHMADTIEIDKATFENLVTKSSRWDEVLKEGYTSVAQIRDEIKQLKQAAADAKSAQKLEQERAEEARKQLVGLIADCAKALNTQQETGQIKAALDKVTAQLDLLDDLQRQYAALQVSSGEKEEELRAEITVLENIIKNSNLIEGASMEKILAELIRRLKNILQGRTV